ncbi:MAG: glycosyltransferase family 2 protein, partial [Ignavibacteria bacterium]|nr:glycosyltransferase family 2 protein [Ignavibacteria bacterium]
MNEISCVIITLNEEENIRRCLQALNWCDEVVIVDSGSSDKTLEICRDFNCKIHHNDFYGYGEQKRFAVSLAENDWVLNVDADEVVSEALKENILLGLNQNSKSVNGFYICRSLFFLGRQFKYGKESKEYYIRLFNKQFANFTEDKVHEGVIVEGSTEKLNGELLHYSYNSIHQYFEKFNNYTTRAARELFEKGKGRSLAFTIIGFPVYFFKNYVINRNFLNGWQGFLWALFSSWYPMVKYAKLWALRNLKSENS